MTLNLNGRVALVTGGSRGIGAAIALALAESGAAVTVNYQSRAVEAESVVAAVAAIGPEAIAVQADVSNGAAVAAMVATVTERLGPIDILINNAGLALVRGIDDLTEADFDQTIAVNLKSAFLCTQAVLPSMRAQGWGRIVNISSGAARGAGGVGLHYNASKAGLEGLTRGYAARLVNQGITVNAVAPSLIETDMVRSRHRGGADAYPARSVRHHRGSGGGRADADRQRLHDRPDRGAVRRHVVQLKRYRSRQLAAWGGLRWSGIEQALTPHQPRIQPVLLQQFGVGAGFLGTPLGQRHNQISVTHGGKPVRDNDGGAALAQRRQRRLHSRLAFGIKGAGRLVQEQDTRIAQEGARQRDTLALAA